jgi:four helix bundle protein
MNQLWRSAGSIAANIAEGYSRGTGADRARFYEYALGSARECVVWYEASREILSEDVIGDRIDSLVHVRRLLLATLPHTRRTNVRT